MRLGSSACAAIGVARRWPLRRGRWWNARTEKPGRRTDEYIGALPRRGGLFCDWGGMSGLKCRRYRGRGAPCAADGSTESILWDVTSFSFGCHLILVCQLILVQLRANID